MAPSIRKYAAKQGLITGVCTLILCIVLFFFLVKTGMALPAIFMDLSMTVGCTGFICMLLQIFLTKGPVKKGVVPAVGNLEDQVAYLLVPKNSIAFLVMFTVVILLVFAFAPIGILAMTLAEGAEVPRMAYIVFKALMAAGAGGYGTYHANVFLCGLFQEKLAAAAK